MTERYPVVPAPDGVPAFDHRAPSPLLRRGIERLDEIVSGSSRSTVERSDSQIELLWIFEPGAQFGFMGDTEVNGGITYIGTELAFFAFDGLSGEELWSYHVPAELLRLWNDWDDVHPSESGSLPPWLNTSDYSVRPQEGIVYLRKGDGLSCLDAVSGSELWSYSPSLSYGGGWTRDDVPLEGSVAIASDDGYHVLDARSGKVTWYLVTRPVKWATVEDSFLTWDRSNIQPTGIVGALWAQSGEVLWKVPIEAKPSELPRFLGQQGVVAIDIRDYSLDDRYDYPSPLGSTEEHPVVAVDAGSGERLWAAKVSGDPLYSTGCPDSFIYIANGISADRISALDIRTGEERWVVQAIRDSGWFSSGNSIYFRDPDDALVALDASSGEVRWTFSSPNNRADVVLASEGTIYANTFTALIALDTVAGTELWRMTYDTSGGKYGAVVAVKNDTVYVANFTGTDYYRQDEEGMRQMPILYAVNRYTGHLQWKLSGYHGWVYQIHAEGSRTYISTAAMVIALQRYDPAEEMMETQTPHFHLAGNELMRLA